MVLLMHTVKHKIAIVSKGLNVWIFSECIHKYISYQFFIGYNPKQI